MGGTRQRKRKRNSISGQFIAHSREMRESAAWWALPDDARRVLDRLEIEHMRHGGSENGKLICTYDDFATAGVRRSGVALALRQCAALGFVEVSRFGYRPQKGYKPPNAYRLTYLNGCGDSPMPTDEWMRLKTMEHAKAALNAAKGAPAVERAASRKTSPLPVNLDSRPICGPRL